MIIYFALLYHFLYLKLVHFGLRLIFFLLCLNLNGQWINFNDSNVTEIENKEYSSSNVSILIYKKVK